MKLSFRWYGEQDPVTLEKIRQIPQMHTIVSAVYDVPVGQVWSRERIRKLRETIESAGLHFEVVESVPVHEDIKRGLPSRDGYIQAYCETLRNLAAEGVRCVCYNFMPVFDWTRTQLDHQLEDGSRALVFYKDQLEQMNPLSGDLRLPGWDESYRKEELAELVKWYQQMPEEALWENLEYFLKAVIPVAEECGIAMAIHPDDPPYPIFGIPRIITCEENLDRFLKLVDSPANGLTFCTGSLGCASFNRIPELVEKYAAMGRIPFLHLRNVKLLEDGGFEESAHCSACGSLDMVEILRRLHRQDFSGYIRPDHGRMIWGETGRPGYGLYDRALGASYITGIWETLERLEGGNEHAASL